MQSKDFQWFLSNYDELFALYGHSFLAIKNGTVLGAYESFQDAAARTLEKEKIGTFIIQECNGNEGAYTVQIASMNFLV